MLLKYYFSKFVKLGCLTITDASGKQHVFAGKPDLNVSITLHNPAFMINFLCNPDLTLGESYMNGELTIESGSLLDLLSLGAKNIALTHKKRSETRFNYIMVKLLNSLSYFLKLNSQRQAKKRIAHHYDLSTQLYEFFLDKNLQYSCAYYKNENDDLEMAQINKIKHIAAKLQLQPGQKVLDIGSGWGGLSLYLAKHYDVTVTGLTLSKEQLKFANQRAEAEGLRDRVQFYLRDYRQEKGQYDRIVSVGMFEHVGTPQHHGYFNQLQNLLSANGIALLHSICNSQRLRSRNNWIQKYIFPGGDIPTLSQAVLEIEKTGLYMGDIELLHYHYAKTLNAWHEGFQQNREQVKALYDERFCRMWEFYLRLSQVGFLYLGMMVFQIQILKNQENARLTRDYIATTEGSSS